MVSSTSALTLQSSPSRKTKSNKPFTKARRLHGARNFNKPILWCRTLSITLTRMLSCKPFVDTSAPPSKRPSYVSNNKIVRSLAKTALVLATPTTAAIAIVACALATLVVDSAVAIVTPHVAEIALAPPTVMPPPETIVAPPMATPIPVRIGPRWNLIATILGLIAFIILRVAISIKAFLTSWFNVLPVLPVAATPEPILLKVVVPPMAITTRVVALPFLCVPLGALVLLPQVVAMINTPLTLLVPAMDGMPFLPILLP